MMPMQSRFIIFTKLSAISLISGLLTAVVHGSRFRSLANFRVSCAVYAEPLSVSHCTGMSSNLYATISVTRHVADDIEDVRLYPSVNFVITPGTASVLSDG